MSQRSSRREYALAFGLGFLGLALGWALLQQLNWIKPLFQEFGVSWGLVYIIPTCVGATIGAVWGERLNQKEMPAAVAGVDQ